MIVLVIVLAVVAIAAIVLALVTRSRLTAAARGRDGDRSRRAGGRRTGRRGGQGDGRRGRPRRGRHARRERRGAGDDGRRDGGRGRGPGRSRRRPGSPPPSRWRPRPRRARPRPRANGLDAEVLWTLERARSERTWRHSVALGPDGSSVFDTTDNPLREALQVELDAAREDVGALVELDTDVPADVTAAGSVLILRAAQELLARAVKAAEETTLRVRVDGADVVVTVLATDEHGVAVALPALAVPPSADLEATDGGVRVEAGDRRLRCLGCRG